MVKQKRKAGGGGECLNKMPGRNDLRSEAVYSMIIQSSFIRACFISGIVLSIQVKTWSSGGDRHVNNNCNTIKGAIEKCQSKEMRSFHPAFYYKDMLRVSSQLVALNQNFLLSLSLLPFPLPQLPMAPNPLTDPLTEHSKMSC